jgi:integrase
VLPANISREGLIQLLARTLAVYYHSPRPRHRVRTTPTALDTRRVLLSYFRMAIADGVFEPTMPSDTQLDEHRLNAALLALEQSDPARYRATPVDPVLRDRHDITEADVTALRNACRTPRERAYLELVSTTGLRSCAIGFARLADVWDPDCAEVRARVHFTEKNNQLRTVTPGPALREALRTYILTDHPGGEYLFPGARRPGRPAPFGARSLPGAHHPAVSGPRPPSGGCAAGLGFAGSRRISSGTTW